MKVEKVVQRTKQDIISKAIESILKAIQCGDVRITEKPGFKTNLKQNVTFKQILKQVVQYVALSKKKQLFK